MNGRERHVADQSERPSQADEYGLYLYGIGRASDDFEHLNLPVADVFRVTEGELSAIVREVPLDEYSEDAIKARVQDYEWLVRSASEHQDTLALVHRHIPILPAKFGTIYPSDQAVRDALANTAGGVLALLNKLDGCDEWALHLFGNEETLREATLASDEELSRLRRELETATPGRAYMLRQRIADRVAIAVDEFQDQVIRDVFQSIRHLIIEFQSDPPNDELRTNAGESEIARASMLVHREQSDAFLDVVDSWPARDSGVRMEVTGPWPPYSFTQVEDDG
jgi:hypothetical protein